LEFLVVDSRVQWSGGNHVVVTTVLKVFWKSTVAANGQLVIIIHMCKANTYIYIYIICNVKSIPISTIRIHSKALNNHETFIKITSVNYMEIHLFIKYAE
jgi:pectin methylesterase-like acyl-CoA thioesterase